MNLTGRPASSCNVPWAGWGTLVRPFLRCCLLVVLLLTACSPIRMENIKPPLEDEGELYIYLQPMGQRAARLRFRVESIEVIGAKGLVIPLQLEADELLNGPELVYTQKLLATGRLPEGQYRGIRITITEAALLTEEGWIDMLVPEKPVFVPGSMEVSPQKAGSQFLTFSPEKSVAADIRFDPVFSLYHYKQDIFDLIGYVSRPAANILSVFNKRTMLLTGVIATGSRPRDLAIDEDRKQAYVALSGEDAIEVIDILQEESTGRIPLRLGDRPEEIAITPDGQWLVTANYGTNTASLVDPVSRLERRRIRVGEGPASVVIDPAGVRAYVLNSLSHSITVIDLGNMEASTTISLEESPLRGAFDRSGERLYVITADSPDVVVIDTATHGVTEKIFTGMGALSILADPRRNVFYVGKKNGELAVVTPEVLMYINAINLSGKVVSMTIDDEENVILALAPDQQALYKINPVNNRIIGRIDLGDEGYAVEVIGARSP